MFICYTHATAPCTVCTYRLISCKLSNVTTFYFYKWFISNFGNATKTKLTFPYFFVHRPHLNKSYPAYSAALGE